jgi:hypothetical protein
MAWLVIVFFVVQLVCISSIRKREFIHDSTDKLHLLYARGLDPNMYLNF